jgi:hypothetical protein
MRVVLHLGAHKTGTSLVQGYFRDQRRSSVRLGISRLNRGVTNQLIGSGQPLLDAPQRLRERLEAERALRPLALLISHENALGPPLCPGEPGLYPRASSLASALAQVLDGFEVQVVYYVRSLADFVESYYLQTIHQGMFHQFTEWYDLVDGRSLRWSEVVATLDEAFGREQVAIGDFSEIVGGPEDFLEVFMRRAKLPVPSTIDYPVIGNPSVSARGLEVAMALNPHLETTEERRAARQFLQSTYPNHAGDRAAPMPGPVRAELDTVWAEEQPELERRSSTDRWTPPVRPPLLPPWRLVRREVIQSRPARHLARLRRGSLGP